MSGGIRIPVSASLDAGDVSKAIAEFEARFNALGAKIAAANKVTFDPDQGQQHRSCAPSPGRLQIAAQGQRRPPPAHAVDGPAGSRLPGSGLGADVPRRTATAQFPPAAGIRIRRRSSLQRAAIQRRRWWWPTAQWRQRRWQRQRCRLRRRCRPSGGRRRPQCYGRGRPRCERCSRCRHVGRRHGRARRPWWRLGGAGHRQGRRRSGRESRRRRDREH